MNDISNYSIKWYRLHVYKWRGIKKHGKFLRIPLFSLEIKRADDDEDVKFLHVCESIKKVKSFRIFLISS